METKKKIKGAGCLVGIMIVILVPVFVGTMLHEEEEKIKQSEPLVKYGPMEVLEETPFTLNPGESEIFDTRKDGVLFMYTVHWTKYTREHSYVKGSVHGPLGKYGADSITIGTIHPHLAVSQPPGAGTNQYYPKSHYLRLQNVGKDTVSGSFQRWGQRVISSTIPRLEK